MFRQSFFLTLKRSIFDLYDFEDSRGADDLLDARRVVDARQLHQNAIVGVGAPFLLHHGLGETQRVDTVTDGLNGAFHRVALQLHQFRWPHVQAVIGRVERREHPRAETFCHHGAQVGCFLHGHAFDGDLNRIGGVD